MTDAPPFPPFNPNPSPALAAVIAADTPKRQQRKKKATSPAAAVLDASLEASGAVPRQRRKVKAAAEKSSLKIDLKTALELSAILNQEDQEAFEVLVGTLQDMGKPTRDRMLAAIAKVFA